MPLTSYSTPESADPWGQGNRGLAPHKYSVLDSHEDNASDRVRASTQDNLLLQPAPPAAPTPDDAASNFNQLFSPTRPKPMLWGNQPIDKIFDPFFQETKPESNQIYNPFLAF